MKWFPHLSFILLQVSSMTGCGKAPVSEKKVIIGDDDRLPVGDSPDGDRLGPLIKAIGMTNYKCTAFHLGGGLVATAGHCFPSPKTKAKHQPCIETSISWENTPANPDPMKSRCVEILAHEHTETEDFALLKVDPYPEEAFEINFSPDYEGDHWVAGHPEGRDLHISSSCELIPKGSHQISHFCDTQPGNSGSPILNQAREVIGIHNGGKDSLNYGTLMEAIPIQDASSQLEHDEPLPGGFAFGPMSHNQSELLFSFSTVQGDEVSLKIALDIEEGYDQVKYVDASGRIRSLSGKKTLSLEKLKTPVLFAFVSDYAGASVGIEVSDIRIP